MALPGDAAAAALGLLGALPPEIVMLVLSFLDVPDLLATSRTCRTFRPLALDPLLHRRRLAHAQHALAQTLPLRPPLSALRPPAANIYLTRTLYRARQLRQRLVGISLDKRLRRRPPVRELVDRGVLPGGCFVRVPAYSPRTSSEQPDDAGWVLAAVSPRLLEARRALERAAVKDKLRRFLSGKGWDEVQRRRREREADREEVAVLARRFASRDMRGAAEELRGGGARRAARTPARANVLRLCRFWEATGG